MKHLLYVLIFQVLWIAIFTLIIETTFIQRGNFLKNTFKWVRQIGKVSNGLKQKVKEFFVRSTYCLILTETDISNNKPVSIF